MPELAVMRLSLRIASLWPGFARAWVLARWEGLVLAAAFAAALNTALVATLAPGTWQATGGLTAAIAWVLALGCWALGLAWLRHDWPRLARAQASGTSGEDDVLLTEAQHAYLKGHWIEAETMVARLLGKQPSDIEARLLLASIRRRSKQWNEARRILIELSQTPAAAKWLLEIGAELRQIEELEAEVSSEREDRKAA
jgi:hypothetical protein